MKSRIENILLEASKPKMTKVYHGTNSLNWDKIQEKGHFDAPLYVTSNYDIAVDYAAQGGELEFNDKMDEMVENDYDGDYEAFRDDWDDRFRLYYRLYPDDAIPVILELLVDLNHYNDIEHLDRISGTYTDQEEPISVVKKVHELPWEKLFEIY